MQKERAGAKGTDSPDENRPVEAEQKRKETLEKISSFLDELDPEEASSFFLMAMAHFKGRTKLAEALSVYFQNIGKNESSSKVDPPKADSFLLKQIRACVTDDMEFRSWGRLFAYSILRNDHFCFEAAENAARIRVLQ